MKKVISIIMYITLFAALMVGCGSKIGKVDDKETDVTQVAFVSQQAFDSSEWLQNLVKSLNEYDESHENIEVKCIEAIDVDEIEPKIDAVCSSGFDIVITAYAPMAEATITCATKYPDIKFGICQGDIADIDKYSNIQQFELNRPDSAFVQGCVAGLMTKTNKVGIVGGVDAGGVNEIIAGWQQGIQYINPNCQDVVTYSNTFTDPTVGKELGLQLVAQGCDVIGAAAGGTGTGTAQAAEESEAMFAAWDIHYEEVCPNMELGSAVNFFEVMFIAFLEDALNDDFEGATTREYGLADGAAGYDFAANDLVSDDIKAQIDEIIGKIVSGEIRVSKEILHK